MRKNNPKRSSEGFIIGNRKKAARQIRTTSRKNTGGSVSTHKMEWGESGSKKYKYSANPTIFPEKDGSWTDLEGKGSSAMKEANKRGEEFGFKSAKRAEKFAAGSWKKGEDRKDSMKKYREAKRKKELYTQSKEFKSSKKK
jgi:hypothetical protein